MPVSARGFAMFKNIGQLRRGLALYFCYEKSDGNYNW